MCMYKLKESEKERERSHERERARARETERETHTHGDRDERGGRAKWALCEFIHKNLYMCTCTHTKKARESESARMRTKEKHIHVRRQWERQRQGHRQREGQSERERERHTHMPGQNRGLRRRSGRGCWFLCAIDLAASHRVCSATLCTPVVAVCCSVLQCVAVCYSVSAQRVCLASRMLCNTVLTWRRDRTSNSDTARVYIRLYTHILWCEYSMMKKSMYCDVHTMRWNRPTSFVFPYR